MSVSKNVRVVRPVKKLFLLITVEDSAVHKNNLSPTHVEVFKT